MSELADTRRGDLNPRIGARVTTTYETARANAGHLLYGRSRNAASRAFRTGHARPDDRSLAPPEGTHAHEYWRAGRDHARRARFSSRVAAFFRRAVLAGTELDAPTERTIGIANRLLDHPRGCLCLTCELAARLGATIRRQEGLEP